MSTVPRSSAVGSLALRSLAALAVAVGVAATLPGPARADSFGFFLADGDRHGRGGRHWRGHDDHRRGRHGHWHGHGRHEHRRHGPPPWAWGGHHGPYWRHPPPYHVRHCYLTWSHWHGGYVRVCR